MKYTKPNFEREWEEATRYREFLKMGKEDWIKKANSDFEIEDYSKIKDVLGNVDLDFDNLDKDKKERFLKSYKKGKIEIPLVVKFSDHDYDLIGGNTRLSGLIKQGENPKLWVINMEKINIDKLISKAHSDIIRTKGKEYSPNAREIEDKIKQNQSKKKQDTKESMGADASGSFEPAFSGGVIKKSEIYKIHNSKLKEEKEIDEAMDASSSGAYDVPLFGETPKGRKNPLSIKGPKSIYKGRAVKDKNFPKYGGPEGVYVKIKEKCKKFPYCNQGNTGAIEFVAENEEIQRYIRETSKELKLPYSELEKLVLNEINKIFIKYENERLK
jgi:hypothetical protein